MKLTNIFKLLKEDDHLTGEPGAELEKNVLSAIEDVVKSLQYSKKLMNDGHYDYLSRKLDAEAEYLKKTADTLKTHPKLKK